MPWQPRPPRPRAAPRPTVDGERSATRPRPSPLERKPIRREHPVPWRGPALRGRPSTHRSRLATRPDGRAVGWRACRGPSSSPSSGGRPSWSSAGVGNGGRTFQQARASNSFEPGSSAPSEVDAVDIVDSFWCSDSAAGQPRAGGAGVKVGGLTAATQAVFGVLGVARNEANTCCAQGDARVTKWPIPANCSERRVGQRPRRYPRPTRRGDGVEAAREQQGRDRAWRGRPLFCRRLRNLPHGAFLG